MTKEETKQYLDILKTSGLETMEAFVAGKTIQFRCDNNDTWADMSDPGWHFGAGQYRIKPEPKYRPYRDLFEFAGVVAMPGKCIIRQKGDCDVWYTIHSIGSKLVVLQTSTGTYDISYETLLNTCEWDDGSPCGVLEKDDNE